MANLRISNQMPLLTSEARNKFLERTIISRVYEEVLVKISEFLNLNSRTYDGRSDQEVRWNSENQNSTFQKHGIDMNFSNLRQFKLILETSKII